MPSSWAPLVSRRRGRQCIHCARPGRSLYFHPTRPLIHFFPTVSALSLSLSERTRRTERCLGSFSFPSSNSLPLAQTLHSGPGVQKNANTAYMDSYFYHVCTYCIRALFRAFYSSACLYRIMLACLGAV